MTCQDIKEIVVKYGTVEGLVKEICTDRACTLGAIQKNLKTKDIEITEPALLAVIARIDGILTFGRDQEYDIGDTVTYQRRLLGYINIGERIGNTIICIEYRNFYLFNEARFKDKAFREHIFSKLEFEELRRFPVDTSDKLKKALEDLNIEKAKWINYVIVDNKRSVRCWRWNKIGGYSDTEYLGKLTGKYGQV